ncbi:MAG: M48 family metalloprotease [Bacteroidota bacterium]
MTPPELKTQVKRTLLSIAFFAVCYILLVAAAGILVMATAYAGLVMIAMHPSFITLVLGAGMIAMSGFIVFMLIRVIFTSQKTDRSAMLEITEADEPKLFALLRELTTETNTAFPKKVYLSADVNAFVFYDSSFLSLFFPAPKNLCIGLGLINSVTSGEFKAVLAHEFGHFSQDSMRVGSYVYQVNRVIYTMLYTDGSYEETIQSIARFHVMLQFVAFLGINTIRGMQWTFRKLYVMVNIQDMKLSREMEFHADQVAASVIGPAAVSSSLLRLGFASEMFNRSTSFCDTLIAENLKSGNMYALQSAIMQAEAAKYKLEIDGNLPVITLHAVKRWHPSRLVVTNQWASHPSDEDRIRRVHQHDYSDKTEHGDPWMFFSNPEKLQQTFTERMYETVNFDETPMVCETPAIMERYIDQNQKWAFSQLFNTYYDQHEIAGFETEQVLNDPMIPVADASTLFHDDHIDVQIRLASLQGELHYLRNLAAEKNPEVKSFDYDGVKYRLKDIPLLIARLEAEETLARQELEKHDKSIFKSLSAGSGQSCALKAAYDEYFAKMATVETYRSELDGFAEARSFMFENQPRNLISTKMAYLLTIEKKFKRHLQELVRNQENFSDFTEEAQEQTTTFLNTDLLYILDHEYLEANIDIQSMAIEVYYRLMMAEQFDHRFQLLKTQAGVLEERLVSA